MPILTILTVRVSSYVTAVPSNGTGSSSIEIESRLDLYTYNVTTPTL